MGKIIDDKMMVDVCKVGQGSECCRYITAGAEGIQCEKGTAFGTIIDGRVANMVAQSDNCEGLNKGD